MVVDPMNVSQLLSPLVDALYGSSLQQKNSFLLDKLNEKVLADKMTLITASATSIWRPLF